MMILSIKPHNRNEYPISGVLIKSASPKVWLHEIQAMNLELHEVKAYAIPSSRANELYGCLLVTNRRVDSIGKNSYLQLIDKALFIPEYATLSPNVAAEEWETLFKGIQCILLSEIGLFELRETIQWDELLSGISKINVKMTMPSKGVFIPVSIKTLRYELSEEDLLKEIENPLSEEELIEQLPFDMKKLLNGNQRELEKYLDYIEKNPEMAMKLGIPLDTLGTSRGNNWGEFSFGGGFLSNLFGSKGSFGMGSWLTSKYTISFLIVLFLGFIIHTVSTTSLPKEGLTLNSASENKAIVSVFLVIMAIVIIRLIFTSSFSVSKENNFKSTAILLIILIIAVLILLYPIYTNEGFGNKLSIVLLLLVGILLYRVFNSNSTILKDDE